MGSTFSSGGSSASCRCSGWASCSIAFAPGRIARVTRRYPFTPLDYFLTATLQHGWHPLLINAIVPGSWSIAAEGTFYLLAPFCHRVVRHWQAALWLLVGALGLTQLTNSVVVGLYMEKRLLGRRIPLNPDGSAYIDWWFPSQLPVFAVRHPHLPSGPGHRRTFPGAGRPARCCWRRRPWRCTRRWGSASRVGSANGFFFSLAFVPLIFGLRAWPAGLLVNRATIGSWAGSATARICCTFLVLRLAENSLDVLLPPAWAGTLPERCSCCWPAWHLARHGRARVAVLEATWNSRASALGAMLIRLPPNHPGRPGCPGTNGGVKGEGG